MLVNILVIGGSSPTGAAGIEADVKTIAAHNLNAAVVITAIASQNTKGVQKIFYLPKEIVKQQLESIFSDMEVEATKVGMLGNREIIGTVTHSLKENNVKNIVLDPVMTAQADGSWLVQKDSINELKKLISISTILTPNKFEAEKLTGIPIQSIEDAKRSAKKLEKLGANGIIIKGIGSGKRIIDLLYYDGKFEMVSKERVNIGTHGGGCCFSSSLAANLARGLGITYAFENAERFIEKAVSNWKRIGKGIEVIEPLAELYENSARYEVIQTLKEAVEIIESSPRVVNLIPEVGMNIVYSLPDAKNVNDIAGVVGRIRKAKNSPKSLGIVEFGASTHLARAVLKMLEFDGRKRAAANIALSEEALAKLKKLGMKVAFYDRGKEPKKLKEKEGASIPWGIEYAVKNSKSIPDVIYHRGDVGKEPMITIFSEEPKKLANIIRKL
jgi:hydroxymethylpyrimidine/phosphomethylpyrimidine kinase